MMKLAVLGVGAGSSVRQQTHTTNFAARLGKEKRGIIVVSGVEDGWMDNVGYFPSFQQGNLTAMRLSFQVCPVLG